MKRHIQPEESQADNKDPNMSAFRLTIQEFNKVRLSCFGNGNHDNLLRQGKPE